MKKGSELSKIELKSHSILLGQNWISKMIMPIPEKRSKVTFLAICFLIGWYFAVKVLAIGLLEFNVSSDLIQHVELGLACSWLFTNTTVLPRFQNVFMNVLEHWKNVLEQKMCSEFVQSFVTCFEILLWIKISKIRVSTRQIKIFKIFHG